MEHFWYIGFRLWFKKMQLDILCFCLPHWTFVPAEVFFLWNLASAALTTSSCSDMFMNFSLNSLTLPLWDILPEVFLCVKPSWIYFCFHSHLGSPQTSNDENKVINFHFLKNKGTKIVLKKILFEILEN